MEKNHKDLKTEVLTTILVQVLSRAVRQVYKSHSLSVSTVLCTLNSCKLFVFERGLIRNLDA